MTNNKYINEIKRIVLDCFENVPASIFLFGSWTRGTQHQGSDVDIAIDCNDAHTRRKIAMLRETLEESTIPYRVDIVDMHFASEQLLEEIRKDGIAWRT